MPASLGREAGGDRNGPHTSAGSAAALPSLPESCVRPVTLAEGTRRGHLQPAPLASGKETRSTVSINRFPTSLLPRDPGCWSWGGGVQALPEGFWLQGWGLCAVRGRPAPRPAPSRGDVAGSLETAVSLQLPSSGWQPRQTHGGRGNPAGLE